MNLRPGLEIKQRNVREIIFLELEVFEEWLFEPCEVSGWTHSYLYVLLVAVVRGRPRVIVVIEPGLSRQPAFVGEGRRCRDLVVGDPS